MTIRKTPRMRVATVEYASTVKSVIIACFVLTGVLVSEAATFTLVKAPSTLADWQSGDFYGGGTAPKGVKTDEVELPADMTAVVTDDSIGFVSGFAQIKPLAKDTSVLKVDVDGVVELGCAVRYEPRRDSSDCSTRGKIMKTGRGTVTLSCSTDASSYFTDIDIQEGALCLTPRGSRQDHFYGRINVGLNGTLIPGADASACTQNWMVNLTGSGIVTNGLGTASNCVILPGYGDGTPVEFSGKILDRIRWYAHGNELLTGTESTFNGGFRIHSNGGSLERGITGLVKIGMAEDGMSSMGVCQDILLVEQGGRLLYLGDGETTDKNVQIMSSVTGEGYPGVIDAGATGGVTFTGRFYPIAAAVERLHLTGSNVNECVIAGNVAPYVSGGKTHYLYVNKKGSGRWRLSDSQNRSGIVGIGIEDGTLAIDSLRERGVMCAIGNGDIFTVDARSVDATDLMNVPYQFRLGTSTSRGNLEYTGTMDSSVSCTTRPIALAGDGGLCNSGTDSDGREASFVFGGVSSVEEGQHTLSLYGTSENNVLEDVSDGMIGSVGLAKEGRGTWILDGDNSFSGPIAVKEGTFVIRGSAGRKFTWYRWTIRQSRCLDLNPPQTNSQISVCEFGFYDVNGSRVGGGLQLAKEYNLDPSDYYKIGVGQVALGRKLSYWDWGGGSTRTPEKMFNDTVGGDNLLCMIPKETVNGKLVMAPCSTNDPNSWISFVMRLDPNEEEVKSYDVACWGTRGGPFPRSWKLEGSTDGKAWVTCDDVDEAPWPWNSSYSSQWSFSKGEHSTGGAAQHVGGREVVGRTSGEVFVCTNFVSVASGATLEADGLVELVSLRLNGGANGTIRGFTFGEVGTIAFDGMDAGVASMTLPISFECVEAIENLRNWRVLVNGRIKTGYTVSVVDGGIRITRPGTILIVR